MLPVYRAIYSAYSKGFHDLADRSEQYNVVLPLVADHRSDDWFLMGSPWPVLCIAASYVYFVTSLGPRFMKNRSAFHVDPIVRVYNLLQIFLSLSVFILALSIGWGTSHNPFCNPIDYSNSEIPIREARVVWLYFILKLLDLCDTIFFVLRKKMQQVSFLHVYHHAAMLVGAWLITKFLPGGHATFIGVANCFVHVVMYSYYFVTSTWPEKRNGLWWKKHITQLQMVNWQTLSKHNVAGGHAAFVGVTNSFVHVVMYSYYFVTSTWPEKRNGLWWKKHITQLQMAQFAFLGLHSLSALLIHNCEYPFSVALIFGIQNVVMFNLFYNFYRKAYSDKKER
ncbi:elongation of very long chain fatty acids protein AAEL008004-like [Zootermopsis nevadensis]|uniref:elongation of very long chain fatty acids protein AAEL008004-like n=1 Tax=Zootermopsis nevadensis TaxID=136037 RepID=UPI000B8EC742|nr:elongation of very long chain fatty acids protein AAEL008004-like [Zootermopsis nevadensis]